VTEPGQRGRRLASRAAIVALGLLGMAPSVRAHWVAPSDVTSQLRARETSDRFGIVSAAPHEQLARMLVVRVDPRWDAVDPSARREAAEHWLTLWREATPQGVLAIVDESDQPRVRFDGNGRASLVGGSPDRAR